MKLDDVAVDGVASHDADVASHDADVASHDADVASHDADVASHDADVASHDADVASSAKDGSKESPFTVAEFFRGRCVFLTGASGFVGRNVIARLLWACPDVRRVYVLLRGKRKRTSSERFEAFLRDDPLFERLRRERPCSLAKLRALDGDLSGDSLALVPADVDELIDNVNVVVHSAATVNFNESLAVALRLNVLATRHVLRIARRCRDLRAFVYVSTAYAWCENSHIEERPYRPDVDYQHLLASLEWMDDRMLAALEPEVLGRKPNTYILSKQLAEQLVVAEGGGLPVAIVRPSIVFAARRDPQPGWTDNLNGPGGLYLGIGEGVIRTLNIPAGNVTNLVPVDSVANFLLSVCWVTARKGALASPTFYNHVAEASPTWGWLLSYAQSSFSDRPSETCIRVPQCSLTGNRYLHAYRRLLHHTLPSYLLQSIGSFACRFNFRRLYRALEGQLAAYRYFYDRQWTWETTASRKLFSALSSGDRRTFDFGLTNDQLGTYIRDCDDGLRRFSLKERTYDEKRARRRVAVLWLFCGVLKFVFVFLPSLFRMFCKSVFSSNSINAVQLLLVALYEAA